MGSPAQGQLQRGDIITKIHDYDARDIRHVDAQSLFRSSGNEIKLVVHRENKLAVTKNITSNGTIESSRCSSTMPPYSPNINLLGPYHDVPHRLLAFNNENIWRRTANYKHKFLINFICWTLEVLRHCHRSVHMKQPLRLQSIRYRKRFFHI